MHVLGACTHADKRGGVSKRRRVEMEEEDGGVREERERGGGSFRGRYM